MSRRSALTCCMYHQACRRRSPCAASAAPPAGGCRASRIRGSRSLGMTTRQVPNHVSAREPLFDGHGRRISDLRVSVTDRCNFRCQYCMPADGLPWLDRDEILPFEEIERLVRLVGEMGVDGRAPDRRRAARAARVPAAGRDARRDRRASRTSR